MEVPSWLINIYQWIVYLTPIWVLLVAIFWKPLQRVLDREKTRLTVIEKKLGKVQKDIEQRKEISRALLHHEIFQTAHIALKQGFITEIELENLEQLYDQYKKLDGNGTAARMYDQCCKLPHVEYPNLRRTENEN